MPENVSRGAGKMRESGENSKSVDVTLRFVGGCCPAPRRLHLVFLLKKKKILEIKFPKIVRFKLNRNKWYALWDIWISWTVNLFKFFKIFIGRTAGDSRRGSRVCLHFWTLREWGNISMKMHPIWQISPWRAASVWQLAVLATMLSWLLQLLLSLLQGYFVCYSCYFGYYSCYLAYYSCYFFATVATSFATVATLVTTVST